MVQISQRRTPGGLALNYSVWITFLTAAFLFVGEVVLRDWGVFGGWTWHIVMLATFLGLALHYVALFLIKNTLSNIDRHQDDHIAVKLVEYAVSAIAWINYLIVMNTESPEVSPVIEITPSFFLASLLGLHTAGIYFAKGRLDKALLFMSISHIGIFLYALISLIRFLSS